MYTNKICIKFRECKLIIYDNRITGLHTLHHCTIHVWDVTRGGVGGGGRGGGSQLHCVGMRQRHAHWKLKEKWKQVHVLPVPPGSVTELLAYEYSSVTPVTL